MGSWKPQFLKPFSVKAKREQGIGKKSFPEKQSSQREAKPTFLL
jgi:hypothetical protein